MSENIKNIYSFIEEEQKNYEKPEGIELEDGWNWQMKEHLRKSYLYLNSQFFEDNKNRKLRPNKNIVLPIMNIQFRTEGFDVKDIELFVDNPDEYYKSLIIKKFHTYWALDNQIDTFIDEMVASYCVYGGALIKKTDDIRPDVIDLRTLAFCDQTDILANPFAIKHKFSFSNLRKANKKWGKSDSGATTDIETLISMVKRDGKKEVEIFEVHGMMPKDWVGDDDSDVDYYDEDTQDVYQIQVVAFYKDENKHSKGVTLFRQKYSDINDFFKFLSRDKIEGRAVGRGGVEELFEAQRWTNWDEIKITEILEAASKTLLWSDDPKFRGRNKLIDVENNEVLSLSEGKTIQQVDTVPRSLSLFNDAVERWQQHAQQLGSGPDPLMGETPTAGTPFKLYEAQQIEGKGMHHYRQGQIAVFVDETYRDWILPHLAREIVKERTFMSRLSADEMQEVVDRVVSNQANNFKKRMILALQDVDEELVEIYKQKAKEDIIKKGDKRFFKLLKDEMKDISLSVMTNIAGKQKNLAMWTDKLVGAFRQYLEMRIKGIDTAALGLDSIMNEILESSGMSPLKYNIPMLSSSTAGQTVSSQSLKDFGQSQVKQQQAQKV